MEPEIKCHVHNLPASTGTTNTGRQYYRCPNESSSRCSFWHWANDPLLRQLNRSSTTDTSTSTQFISQPMPSNPSGSQESESTLPKRGFQQSPSSPKSTTSGKRTKVEANAPRETLTPLHLPSQGREPTSTPSRGSQRRLEDIKKAFSPEGFPNRNNADDSSRNLFTLPGQTASTTTDALGLSNSHDLAMAFASGSHSQSSAQAMDIHGIGINSASKGKNPIRTAHNTPFPRHSIDVDNPFVERNAQNQRNTPNVNPPLLSTTGLSADSISVLLSSLEGIPDYLRKLERRLMAADQANVIKARRIFELEEEIERLKQEKETDWMASISEHEFRD